MTLAEDQGYLRCYRTLSLILYEYFCTYGFEVLSITSEIILCRLNPTKIEEQIYPLLLCETSGT